jgi:hypothetical protein
VYRDVRVDAGRQEFCELHLDGSLRVNDGPSRWWYSEGHFGEEGAYRLGRKIGSWKECDRFGRCRTRRYEQLYPQETARRIRPELPVQYSRGKYVFDFRSCWSTWITRQTPDSFVELNIGGSGVRCQVTYIPSTRVDRPAGNAGHYLCEIPYEVGVREFNTLDLRTELPEAGLPQFCRSDERSQPFALWGYLPSTGDGSGKPISAWTPLANAVDVECAALQRDGSRRWSITLRLNAFAERLVTEQVGKYDVKGSVCPNPFPAEPVATGRDTSGRTLFTLRLSANARAAQQQRACIAKHVALQRTCR